MAGDPGRPPFPGAIGASHLRVYDTEAPDGLPGGTPHIHTVCTEAYYVIAGHGAVQTLTMSGFQETTLEPGAFVWFTPGTIHRLINGGGLEILVLMQNSGLPEAGDMVVTLPPAQLTDRDTYDRVAILPEAERTTSGTGDAARHRRDLAVEGFVDLRHSATSGDYRPLRDFHDAATRLVEHRLGEWRALWLYGPLAEARRTGDLIEALARGDTAHLAEASVHALAPAGAERRMGCCGTLGTLVP